MAILRREKTHTRPPESGVGGGMRPGGPTSEAGCTLKGPRACVARGGGAEAKRGTGEAGCGPPGRVYKGAPPTPIFRGSAQTKSAANGPPSIQSCVKDRSPKGRDRFASSQRWPGSREPGARSAGARCLTFTLLRGLEQFQMTHAQRRRQFVNRDDGRVAPAILQAAKILLTETGFFGKPFLGQAPFEPNLANIFPNQNPHIHARRSAGSHQISLSTPVCTGKRLNFRAFATCRR